MASHLAASGRDLPITTLSEYARAGLLMSFGPNLNELYDRAAAYVDKLLRGAKAGELPLEQQSRFELTVNMRKPSTDGAAQAGGITEVVPPLMSAFSVSYGRLRRTVLAAVGRLLA